MYFATLLSNVTYDPTVQDMSTFRQQMISRLKENNSLKNKCSKCKNLIKKDEMCTMNCNLKHVFHKSCFNSDGVNLSLNCFCKNL